MREAGFRSGKRKPRISGVRHKGDTAVFPCFFAVTKKAFPHKKTAPEGRLFRHGFGLRQAISRAIPWRSVPDR
ncbi:hypothetical protein NIBR502774_12440 [Rhizobium sp. NIBRBAC000502774]|nr:hypothetical protein NIBR502774_12440 [Rhizobium sp. NIBRBAC000502774]